jgi:four helix bundle protein
MVQNYRDLKVWQKAMSLAREVYRVTENFPKHQRYGLVSQMQRAAISVPANIAEGRSRHSGNEFAYFLNIARGSLAELETYLILSHDLDYIASTKSEELLSSANEITKMLFGLRDKISENAKPKLQPVTSNL